MRITDEELDVENFKRWRKRALAEQRQEEADHDQPPSVLLGLLKAIACVVIIGGVMMWMGGNMGHY